LPLAKKYFLHAQTFLQVPLLIIQLLEITEEGLQEAKDLQEAEGLEEEAKVSSFLWLSAFPLELVPFQLL
jgi:hypothetical protein